MVRFFNNGESFFLIEVTGARVQDWVAVATLFLFLVMKLSNSNIFQNLG